MARSVMYWDFFAKKYSNQPIKDKSAYQIKLNKTREYLTGDSLVFEFGCATGSTALIHAPLVKKIVAIDYSQNMINIAKRRAKKKGVYNVEFIKADFLDWFSQPATYDVVLGLNVLHLFNDLDEAIKKSYDLLKPGGIFITSTVCIAEYTGFTRYAVPAASAIRAIPFLRVFGFDTLKNNIIQTGFTMIESCTPGVDKCVIFIIAKK